MTLYQRAGAAVAHCLPSFPSTPSWEVLLGGGITIHKMSLGEGRLDTYECDLDGSASDAGILGAFDLLPAVSYCASGGKWGVDNHGLPDQLPER